MWIAHLVAGGLDQPESVAVFDAEADGDLDVVIASAADDTVAVELGDGAGGFPTSVALTTDLYRARAVSAVDLDGDGDLDVLATGEHGAAWFENLGGGAFGPQIDLDVDWIGFGRVAAGDLDGDGDADLAAAIAWTDALVLLENAGGTYVQRYTDRWDPLTHAWVDIGDLDGDGDLDLVTSGLNEYYGGGDTRLYANGGGFAFSATTISGDAYSVGVFDLDGDGDLDVYTSESNPYWFENAPGWPKTVMDPCTAHPESSLPADLDADGDVDLVCAEGGAIRWSENLGASYAKPEALATGGLWWDALGSGDLDGDGDLDLVLVDLNADQVQWLENPWGPPATTTPAETGDTGATTTTGGSGATPTTPSGSDPGTTPTTPGPTTSAGSDANNGCGCGATGGLGGWGLVLLAAWTVRARSRGPALRG